MGRSIRFLLLALAVCSTVPAVRAGLIFEQEPFPAGGPAADTQLYYFTPEPVYQLVADDVRIGSDAEVQRLVWWGLYGGLQGQSTNPPPGDEYMRVRFYDARTGDGLPGDVVFEHSFLNPQREDTGRIVGDGSGAHEFRFQADFPNAFPMQANFKYRIEIVQDGEANSHFRWEYSLGDGSRYAIKNSFFPYWQYSELDANVAFQLWSIPEPSSLLSGVVTYVSLLHHKKRRRSRRQAPKQYVGAIVETAGGPKI